MEQRQSHLWIEQFCVQLLRSRPDLHYRVAVRRAIATFPHAADLHPHEAARLFVAALPPRADGAATSARARAAAWSRKGL
jgi:hypothetical protein